MPQTDAEYHLERAAPEQHVDRVSRRSILKTGAVAASVLGFSGTANARKVSTPSELNSNSDTAEGTESDFPNESNSESEALITQFNDVYVATRKYQSVATAREDGYAPAMVVPNVGHILAINDRIGDGEVNITKPEALIYVDTRTTGGEEEPADADLDLAAIEYVVPGDQSENPPDVFADENTSYPLKVTEEEGWHHNEEVGVTGLHVWLHHWNTAGLFNLTNPAVSAESSLNGRTGQ